MIIGARYDIIKVVIDGTVRDLEEIPGLRE
jgi:hypothetical protein